MDSDKVVREYHWIENLFKFNGKDHIKKDGILIELLPDNSVSDEYQNKYFLVNKESPKQKGKAKKKKPNVKVLMRMYQSLQKKERR